MFKQITDGPQELGVVVSVSDPLIHNHFAVQVFTVNDLSFAVQFGGMPFGTESDENGERPEIIDVVINRTDPNRGQ